MVYYCLAIVGISVLGGLIPAVVRLTHRRLQFGLALVAGVMLGVGLLHMLGHAIEIANEPTEDGEGVSISAVMLAALGGFLLMFLLERFFCFHHHEHAEETSSCSHGEADAPACSHSFGWVGAFVGMSVHTLLAGFALGAAGAAGTAFTVFLGILLHKPFDSFTVVALMRREGRSKKAMHIVNLFFALLVPVGVGVFMGSSDLLNDAATYTALALAFSGGTFICIASSDLLPELQFHNHDRLGITAAFILGLAIAWGSGLVGHSHEHGPNHDHDHDHDHHHEHASLVWGT